jgi:drug/metabolite transporter (DMT)-like permease
VPLDRIEKGYNLLMVAGTGVVMTFVGVWLVWDPDLGAPPAGPRTPSDYVPGAAAALVGVVILAFCTWVTSRSEGKGPTRENDG